MRARTREDRPRRRWQLAVLSYSLLASVGLPASPDLLVADQSDSIRSESEVIATGAAAVARYEDQRLASLGFLDATKAPYNADATGERDATAAIQQALSDARDARLVCLLPPGRYLVSDTIQGVVGVVNWDRWPYQGSADPWVAEASFHYPCVLTGARGAERSTLVLQDNAAGFNDPEDPKPVLYFWARSMQSFGPRDPDTPQPNINFNQKILHLDIELGRGTPGRSRRAASAASISGLAG